jgi:hypothetical protein
MVIIVVIAVVSLKIRRRKFLICHYSMRSN